MRNECSDKCSRFSRQPPLSTKPDPHFVPPASVLTESDTMNQVEINKALEWLEGYTIKDTEQVYTNGAVLVPLFRVKQAFEDRAYNGLYEV